MKALSFSWDKQPLALRALGLAAYRTVISDALLISAAMSYTALLTFFPFIIFLSALTGFLSQTQLVQNILTYFFRFAPREVTEVLQPVIAEITKIKDGGLITFGILGTLWVMVSSMETLRVGINRAYNVEETRSFMKRYAQSLVIVIGVTISLTFVALVMPLGPVVFELLTKWFHVSISFGGYGDTLRYVAGALVMLFTIAFMYLHIPNLEQSWQDVMPGAASATVLWIVLVSSFSLYLSHAQNYSVTYGSLSGIIITLLFFQLSGLFVLFGAEVNQACREDGRA